MTHICLSLIRSCAITLVSAISVAVATVAVATAADEPVLHILPLGDSITMAAPGYRAPLHQALTKAGRRVDFVGNMSDKDAVGYDGDHEGHGGFAVGPGLR